jgi:hypothetical protein
MNQDELNYRFSEIATTIDLLPEVNMEGESPDTDEWRLPNGTLGLSDPTLYSALLCQALKGAEDYRFKFVATITNTAIDSINNKVTHDQEPNEDDLTALAISINVLWAEGVAGGLFKILGLMANILERHDGLEMPNLTTAIFRPNENVDMFGKLDPIDILNGLDIAGMFNQIKD